MAVGELRAEMGIRCHTEDVLCYWSNLEWTRKGSCLTERKIVLPMQTCSSAQLVPVATRQSFGAINPFLALHGNPAWVDVLYPCILLQKEGIKRTLEGTLAHWPRISMCLQAFPGFRLLACLQGECTVTQFISRVQPQASFLVALVHIQLLVSMNREMWQV